MDAVVEAAVNGRNHADVREAALPGALGLADAVPAGHQSRVRVRDKPAELDVIERQIGLPKIGAEGLNQRGHARFIECGIGRVGVGLALIPQYSGDLAADGLDTLQSRAIEGMAALSLTRGVPLLHRGPAVGGGD